MRSLLLILLGMIIARALYVVAALPSHEINQASSDVIRLQAKLDAANRRAEVEYWSHQCDNQTRVAMAKCGCKEAQ